MNKSKLSRILQRIKEPPQGDHFFKKLATTDKPFPWLRALKEKGYFDGDKNPPPREAPGKKGYFTIPRWNVLGYLENVAIKNVKNPSDEITEILIDIVGSISKYQNDQQERVENYQTDWFLVKIISKLPLTKITQEHIRFIDTALRSKWDTTLVASEIGKSLLPKLIGRQGKELLLKLIDVILGYRRRNQQAIEKYDSVADTFWLRQALKRHKPAIAKLCSIEAAEIALGKMLAITNEDKSQFNFVWIPTIEDHSQTTFPDRYECQLVHFVRDMLESSDPHRIKARLNELVEEEHPIFRRIALYIINRHYEHLNGLFWDWKDNPLDEVSLTHELYELLKNNCSSFSRGQIRRVLGWIESKDYHVSREIKGNEERAKNREAFRKKEWISSLLTTKDPGVMSLYEKYNRINPEEVEHPGFLVWGDIQVGTTSPIEGSKLLGKSNKEVAEYLIGFKEENGWKKPTQEGLSGIFRNCVSEDPQKFAINIEPFLNVHTIYQHALLWGFSEAWRAKKDFAWRAVLDFMQRIIEADDFWTRDYGKNCSNYRNWIISQIADLIEQGTQNDSHAFERKLLAQAERILLVLAEKTKSDLSEMTDLVTSVLNSSKGKIFSAMVEYSLRSARMAKSTKNERWIEPIKDDFDKRLDRDIEPSLEYSVTLGKYLASLSSLDKKWVADNINRLFPKNDDKHWRAGFTGYLFYASGIYRDIYFLLRRKGHYAKALWSNFVDHGITERLVQHVCVGYLEGWEKLDDDKSLMFQLIKRKNVAQLLAMVSFFWMQRDKLDDRMKAKVKVKVKPLWGKLFEIVSRNERNPEYQKIASDLSRWLSLVDGIDLPTLEWLKLSARYAQTHFATPSLIEYLLKHASTKPAEVGEIYLEMLKSDCYPDYKKEDIQDLIRVLYDQGEKEPANRICNMYGARGLDFLRAIYEEHRDHDS